jgi:hypothetical protein
MLHETYIKCETGDYVYFIHADAYPSFIQLVSKGGQGAAIERYADLIVQKSTGTLRKNRYGVVRAI